MNKSNHIPRQFYRDLQKWIKQGCPQDNPYYWMPTRGICAAWIQWGIIHNRSTSYLDLASVFSAAGLNKLTPFNPPEYGIQFGYETCKFTNPARLAWIKEHCK